MDRDGWTVVRMGLAFFLIFTAFNSQGYIEIAVIRNLSEKGISGLDPNSGYYSFCITYLFFTISNLIVPPVISKLGAKWAMVIGGICYGSFLLGFLFLRAWLLYTLSAFVGIGAALLWIGNGVYLVRFSSGGQMTRNSAIMWTMFQSSLVAGAVFLAVVLMKGDLVSSYRFIYGVFFGLSVLGILILATLPSDSHRSEETQPLLGNAEMEPPATFHEEFASTFSLFITKRMAIFTFISAFLGIQGSYLGAVYTACIAATTRLSSTTEAVIAFNVLSMGVAEIICGFLLGLGKTEANSHLGRKPVVAAGTFLIIVVSVLSIINLPDDSPMRKTDEKGIIEPSLLVSLITAFCIGLADSCWQTQTLTVLGGVYKGKLSSPAFAIFRFFQAMAAGVAFLYGSMLSLHWQLFIISLTSIMALLAFDRFQKWSLNEEQEGLIVDQEDEVVDA